ncbi:MAG: hypothetical protein HZB98_08905 [Bacteroidia bacterium]|nr:hypothetical protein [Bacteroidia bacterium]
MYNANNTSGSYHRYVRKVAGDNIILSQRLNDGTIPERVFRKIQWYMVEALIIGEMLARLSDKRISSRDKEGLVYLGAVMALFDVFVDDFRFQQSELLNILDRTFSPGSVVISDSDKAIEKIYFSYLERLLIIIEREHWAEIHKHLSIIKLQIESGEQYEEKTTEEEVLRITLGKGGVSALICSAFLGSKDESFKSAVFETGGFIQMMNDCQDIYKDTVSGIRTFAHFCQNFTEIFMKMNEQRIRAFSALMSPDLPAAGKSAILFELNAMFIVISYKLHLFARACSFKLDFTAIRSMDKKHFIINPFSPRSIAACSVKILEFDPADIYAVHVFKFEKS